MSPQTTRQSAVSKNTVKKSPQSNYRARALVEKQLKATERLETEAIMKKRALKAKFDKQKQQAERVEAPQIPTVTIGNPWKPSSYAFQSRESRRAAETKPLISVGVEEPSNHQGVSKRHSLVTEYLKSQNSNATSQRGGGKQKIGIWPKDALNGSKHRNQRNLVRSAQAKESDLEWVPSSIAPNKAKDKEILYDFTQNISNTASMSSAQSDVYTDGSMLSPKSIERDLPSSMELDDGVLHDRRSTESVSWDMTLEVQVPKTNMKYMPPSYTSVSDEGREFPPYSEQDTYVQVSKDLKKRLPRYAGLDNTEVTQNRNREQQGEKSHQQKQRRIFRVNQRKQPPKEIVPNSISERSLSGFLAMQKQMLAIQEQLNFAQKEMEAILPIINEFSGTMNAFVPSANKVLELNITQESPPERLSSTPHWVKRIQQAGTAVQGSELNEEAQAVTRLDSLVFEGALEPVPSIEVGHSSEQAHADESLGSGESIYFKKEPEDNIPRASSIISYEVSISNEKWDGLKSFSQKRDRLDTPPSSPEYSASKRSKSGIESLSESSQVTESRTIYTPFSTSPTPQESDSQDFHSEDRNLGKGLAHIFRDQLRLITPITVFHKSVSRTPEPVHGYSSHPMNPKFEKVKQAYDISPTIIPLPNISSSNHRTYTPSSISSEATSSLPSSMNSFASYDSRAHDNRRDGKFSSSKKTFALKKIQPTNKDSKKYLFLDPKKARNPSNCLTANFETARVGADGVTEKDVRGLVSGATASRKSRGMIEGSLFDRADTESDVFGDEILYG